MNRTFGTGKALISGALFFLIALVSCEKKSISFGQEFAENFTNVVLIDTVTPVLSTYKIDSFGTSGSGTAIVGSYNDPQFGNISATSFFQLALPSYDIPTTALYDSLVFIVTPLVTQYYGDTLAAQQMSVNRLQSTLEFAPEKTQFYNTDSFPSDPVPLGTQSFIPRPSRIDTIHIRLSNAFGNELFNKLKQKDADVLDQESFLRYFKGVVLSSSPQAAALINYQVSDSALNMRLYYREQGTVLTQKVLNFAVTSTNLQFNHIRINRTGTPLQNLPPNYPLIPSGSLGNAAFTQYATGLLAKVSFPSIQNLLNVDKSGKILKAELVIKPLAGTFRDNYTLPPQLTLATTDKTNLLGPAVASASLFTDYYTGENTGYTFDLTSFLQQQIALNVVNQQSLFIYVPSMSAFSRLVIGDLKSGASRIQLNINYLIIK